MSFDWWSRHVVLYATSAFSTGKATIPDTVTVAPTTLALSLFEIPSEQSVTNPFRYRHRIIELDISLNGRPNTHRPATQRTCRLCRLARRWDTLRSRCERFAGSAGCSVGATATVTAFRPSEDGRAAARRLSRRCQSLRGWANWLRQLGRDFSQNWRSRALNCAKFEKNLHQRTFFKILG